MNLRDLAIAAGIIVSVGAYTNYKYQDAVEHQLLIPYGDPVEGLQGQEWIPDGTPTFPLVRIDQRPVIDRGYMGPYAEEPSSMRITTWRVEGPDGRTYEMHFQGAINMLPGETLEEARERFNKTQQ